MSVTGVRFCPFFVLSNDFAVRFWVTTLASVIHQVLSVAVFIFVFAFQSNFIDSFLKMFSPKMLDALAERLFARVHAGGSGSKFVIAKQNPVEPSQQSPKNPAAPSQSPKNSAAPSQSPVVTPKAPPVLNLPTPEEASFLDKVLSRRSSSVTTADSESLDSSQSSSLSRSSSLIANYGSDSSQSSSLSRSSSLSLQSQNDGDAPSESLTSESFDSYDLIQNKRGAKVVYSAEDKIVVNVPLMGMLDGTLLAPIKSNLFMYQRKKDGDDYGKNAQLNFDEFKALIKSLIRSLVAKNSTDKTTNLAQKYFWCAYDLVRKRRANHIQMWRRFGCPKELIYGGKAKFIATYGDPWTNNPRYNNKKKKRRTRKRKLLFGNKPPAHAKINKSAGHAHATVAAPISNQPAGHAHAAGHARAAGHAHAAGHITESAVLLQDSAFDPFNHDAFDPFDLFSVQDGVAGQLPNNDLFYCLGCGKPFEKKDAFPRNNAEWNSDSSSSGVELRCARCFDRHTRENYLVEVNEEVTKEEAMKEAAKAEAAKVEAAKAEAAKGEAVEDAKGEAAKGEAAKREAAEAAKGEAAKGGANKNEPTKAHSKPCKCGAFTHKLSTSKLCPLNKKYNRHEICQAVSTTNSVAATAAGTTNLPPPPTQPCQLATTQPCQLATT